MTLLATLQGVPRPASDGGIKGPVGVHAEYPRSGAWSALCREQWCRQAWQRSVATMLHSQHEKSEEVKRYFGPIGTMQLDGASSPRSYFFSVRNLPAGYFDVRALVRRADNTTAVARRTLRVVRGPR